jgi:hypothetical protein
MMTTMDSTSEKGFQHYFKLWEHSLCMCVCVCAHVLLLLLLLLLLTFSMLHYTVILNALTLSIRGGRI